MDEPEKLFRQKIWNCLGLDNRWVVNSTFHPQPDGRSRVIEIELKNGKRIWIVQEDPDVESFKIRVEEEVDRHGLVALRRHIKGL